MGNMKISRVTLREIRMKLLAPFQTSFGSAHERRILLVAAEVDGVIGWGEIVAGEYPGYSPETIDTARLILTEYLWPAVRGREVASANDVSPLMCHVRGHEMAKAGLETAAWDAEAKLKNVSLWKLLGGTRREIPCGVSIGIQENHEKLLEKIEKELADGYQRIKIKIAPGRDVLACEAVRARFPDIRLMVDANSAYRLEDLPLLRQLDRFHLMMIEQPLDWDDIYAHALLQREIETPVCLDECIHAVHHARAAIELGACRIINMKLGRVGGHRSVRAIHDLCQANGIPLWCGGMLESGIGRAHNIALSTLPNFKLPGDVSASRRYWTEDIIEPAVEVSPHGTILPPEGPGIGFTPKLEMIERLTVSSAVLD
jgi:O-succinylbenzoate synthase